MLSYIILLFVFSYYVYVSVCLLLSVFFLWLLLFCFLLLFLCIISLDLWLDPGVIQSGPSYRYVLYGLFYPRLPVGSSASKVSTGPDCPDRSLGRLNVVRNLAGPKTI